LVYLPAVLRRGLGQVRAGLVVLDLRRVHDVREEELLEHLARKRPNREPPADALPQELLAQAQVSEVVAALHDEAAEGALLVGALVAVARAVAGEEALGDGPADLQAEEEEVLLRQPGQLLEHGVVVGSGACTGAGAPRDARSRRPLPTLDVRYRPIPDLRAGQFPARGRSARRWRLAPGTPATLRAFHWSHTMRAPADLSEFTGILPYSSELMGIYQPLIGWQGRQGRERVDRERSLLAAAVTNAILADQLVRAGIAREPRAFSPNDIVPPQLPSWATAGAGVQAKVQRGLDQFVRANGRMPTGVEWAPLVTAADLQAEVMEAARNAVARGPVPPVASASPPPPAGASIVGRMLRAVRIPAEVAAALGRVAVRSAGRSPAPATGPATEEDSSQRLVTEAVIGGTLTYLAQKLPSTLLLRGPAWQRVLAFMDPLARFDEADQRAVVSPVGVLQVYREYFFELGSFLGPAVEHLWLSPGSSLELYEVHTRRTQEERTVELSFETLSRSETQQTGSDELSDGVSQMNSRNMMFGMTATAGVNFGVAQASTTATLSSGAMQMSAQMAAHKELRGQSETIAKEIRASRKTTFRTTVEAEDTSSRRYVVSNNTKELVNYELRRKMRRVGVQVQHVGSRLCWQTYVPAPGALLVTSHLVHAASPTEAELGLEPPAAPDPLKTRSTETTVEFQFVSFRGHGVNDGVYASEMGTDVGRYVKDPGHDAILSEQTYSAEPPVAGYELDEVSVEAVEGKDPQREPPKVYLGPQIEVLDGNSFKLHLVTVDFRSQSAIVFRLRLIWKPTADTVTAVETAHQTAVTQFEETRAQALRSAMIDALRQQVVSLRSVAPRPGADLRAEERSVVYQSLLATLTGFRADRSDEQVHVTSELLRALFDLDAMLYFVAPDWWKPRDAPEGMVTGNGQRGRPYLVTEESQPAPFGASLGWKLQADGDLHRNAFLNTPWVKAVIPIQPGREEAALKWLEDADVEGKEGLELAYPGTEPELRDVKDIREALLRLARRIQADNTSSERVGEGEKLFTTGFDPLEVLQEWDRIAAENGPKAEAAARGEVVVAFDLRKAPGRELRPYKVPRAVVDAYAELEALDEGAATPSDVV
jgi:hypothetical protein